jgi:DNA-directed RNA polymerase subunit K/omega
MLRCRKFLIRIICLSIIASTICSYAEEEIEDLIDIAESNGKIIAILEGRKTITFDLRPNEKVLWSGANGYLGAFLTDSRFFVISISLDAWQALPLRIDESGKSVASLSAYIALLVTKDRAVGFDATSNRFIETQLPMHDELLAAETEKYVAVVITSSRAFGLVGFDATSNRFIETLLPIHDELLAAEAERYVAVVITSSRAFGLAAESSAFTEIHLRVGETLEEIKLTYSKATVRTSDRLLTFEASGLPWKELRF